VKYAFIREHYRDHSVLTLCRVMGVSTSGYYDWYARPASHREQTNRRLLTKIQCFHKASRSIYGSPRIHKDLLSSGEQVGVNLIAKLMKDAEIKSKMARKFIITTNSKNTLAPSPDLLQRDFDRDEKDEA